MSKMGFDGNNNFSIAYAGFSRFQKELARSIGLTEEEIINNNFDRLNSDIILEILIVDNYWELPNEKCLELAKRLENEIENIKEDYHKMTAINLVNSLIKTYNDGDKFIMF